jgi:hypothetical protein
MHSSGDASLPRKAKTARREAKRCVLMAKRDPAYEGWRGHSGTATVSLAACDEADCEGGDREAGELKWACLLA